MIQRIQSLHLLTATICSAVLFFLPLAQFNGDMPIDFSVSGYSDTSGNRIESIWSLSVLLAITVLLQFSAIFLYRKRRIQAILSQAGLILLLLFVAASLLYHDVFPYENGIEPSFNWNIGFAPLSWIFNWLAVRAIRKDEAIVRSVDRLR